MTHGKSTLPRRAALAGAVSSAKDAALAGRPHDAARFLDLALAWLDVPDAEIREAQVRVDAIAAVPQMMNVRESRRAESGGLMQ